MIQYFRKALPDRFVVLFVLLLLFRITAWMQHLPLLKAELDWQVLGERLSHGWLLYRNVWDDLPPLSAGFYALSDLVFGRSVAAYRIFSLLLVAMQAMQFQYLTKKPLFSENTLLPAFLYLLGTNLFLDFFTVSPPLLALGFLLPALGRSLNHIENPQPDESLFAIGFLTGLAAQFYLPAALFLLCILFGLTVVGSMNLRKIFLVVFGFLFVFGLVFIFFFFNKAQEDFLYCYFSDFTFSSFRFSGFSVLFFVSLPLLTVVGFGFLRAVSGNVRLINYQLRSVQFMFFWGITALLTTQIGRNREPFQLLMFVPVLTYFGTHLFLSFRRAVFREVTALLLVGAIGYISLSSLQVLDVGGFWQAARLADQPRQSQFAHPQ